jgi:hypothetical protein
LDRKVLQQKGAIAERQAVSRSTANALMWERNVDNTANAATVQTFNEKIRNFCFQPSPERFQYL